MSNDADEDGGVSAVVVVGLVGVSGMCCGNGGGVWSRDVIAASSGGCGGFGGDGGASMVVSCEGVCIVVSLMGGVAGGTGGGG